MDRRLPVELVAQKRKGRGKKSKVTMKQHEYIEINTQNNTAEFFRQRAELFLF